MPGRWFRLLAGLAVCVAAGAGPASAQSTAAPGDTKEGEAPPRPGKYKIGPLYFTPRLRLGPIGLDTNVLYSPTERQADVMMSIGPGLEMVLPVAKGGRLYAQGSLDYLYFVRTASQRQLVGGALGGLALRGARTSFVAEGGYQETFLRPTYQVDERVRQTTEALHAELDRRLFGHIGLGLFGSLRQVETESDEPYLGTDLSRVLSFDDDLVRAELRYEITPKTSFVVQGEAQWTRYSQDPTRNADRQLAAAGFRTDATALIAGRALVGIRYYQLQRPGAPRQDTFYADVEATLNLSPRTKVGATYLRDIRDSIFDPVSPESTPTVAIDSVGVNLLKALTSRLDLRLFARRSRSVTDGAITVEIPEQGPVTAVRDDRIREAGADLGYRFRPNFRLGLVATYTDRNSSISYFGVDGLLVGFNAQFNPN